MSIFYQIELDNRHELEVQKIPLQNINEACDIADRLRFFLLGKGISVSLFEVDSEILDSGEEIYNKRSMEF